MFESGMLPSLVNFKSIFMLGWVTVFSTKSFCQVLDKGTINIPKGEPYELKCQNITNGPFASLVWTSNAYSGNAKKTVYSYDIDGKMEIKPEFAGRIQRINQTSLRIMNARIGDSGNWECNILFQYTPKDAPPRLRVQELAIYKLVVIGPPKNLQISSSLISAKEGKNTTVFCDVQGQSSFEVTWRKLNGSFKSNVHFTNITKAKDGYFIERNKMTFLGFSRENEGVYECRANNIGGTAFRRVSAHVLTIPMIYGRSYFNINVYDTGKLVCKAKGYPRIVFLWKFYDRNRNLTLIRPLAHVGGYSVSESYYDNTTSIGRSELTIERVQKYDLDYFTCIATNDIGSDQKDIILNGYAPPDAPVIIKSEIRSYIDKVSLAWNLGSNGGKPITSITIKYKNSSSESDWDTLQITQSFTEYTVNNLHHSTWYDFQVLATNEIGDSEYSQIVRAETLIVEPTTIEHMTSSNDFFSQFSIPAVIGIFGGTALAIIIAIACTCIFVQRIKGRGSKNSNIPISATTFDPNSSLLRQGSVHGTQMEMDRIIRTDEWEFPRDRLTITTVLGAGAFGLVMRGLAQGIKGSVGQITVAVKTVRDPNNEAATKDLMAELNLLKVIPEHPNVLGLLGCCTRSEPLYVIVEYCANGDLQGFLRSSRGIYERYYKTSYGGTIPNLTSKMIMTFAWQIAKGMAHLSAMKVIHRDLASRNVLVDDQLTCKVSDFGFARDIYLEDHYLKRSAGGRFPIKWMAIESLLDGISTTKSDVWSFGVVLWELITLGASPYPGMSSYEVVSFLQDGYRMDKPKHASNEVYALMMDCWSVSPGRRPSFNEVADRCQELVNNSEDLINMSFYQDHLYVNFDSTGTGSAAVSTTTTPHGTLGRDRTNNVHQPPLLNPSQTPKTLRSTSQISVRSGGRHNSITESRHNIANGNSRSNSVTGLSDRSATGVSNISNRDERAVLLPPIPQ